MKPRTPQQVRILAIAFAVLVLLTTLLLWQGVRHGDAVRVGIPKSYAAAGAAPLLQTSAAQYVCTLGSTTAVLQKALLAGDLDAALIPYDMAVNCEGCEIRAILGYEQLLLLGRREATHIQDLDNCMLTLPQKLQDSALAKMLEALLKKEDTICSILYSDDFSEAEWIACGLDDAAAILRAQPEIRICFSITRSARHALDTAPYGLCLAVRKDYLQQAGTDYDAFERMLQDAVHYADDKRKKTVAMMASSGIAADETEANLFYPYCSFRYMDSTTLE